MGKKDVQPTNPDHISDPALKADVIAFQKEARGFWAYWDIWAAQHENQLDAGNLDAAEETLELIEKADRRYRQLVERMRAKWRPDFEEFYFPEELGTKPAPTPEAVQNALFQ